jgi:hypothetical protein
MASLRFLRWSHSFLALVLLSACGGTVSTIGGQGADGGDDARPDSSLRSDGATGADSGEHPDAVTTNDASSLCHVTGAPLHHRPTATSCPNARGPGVSVDAGPDAAFPGTCTNDSQCTEGNDGRCLRHPFGAQVDECSYDECYDDGDCKGIVPCICRPSPSSNQANVCGTGSNCSLDSDCGPCGFCSPSENKMTICGTPETTYFCHTPSDTCVNDSDCSNSTCNYDPSLRHWACGAQCGPPPP